MLIFFETYIEWRLDNKNGLSNMLSYRGLDPESKFFLKDRGESYKLTLRKAGTSEYQPRSMNHQLKRMIARTSQHGATPSSFHDSYVRALYENGCGWKDLMKVTGIKQKRTLKRKIRPEESELDKVFKHLFSKVKIPK